MRGGDRKLVGGEEERQTFNDNRQGLSQEEERRPDIDRRVRLGKMGNNC